MMTNLSTKTISKLALRIKRPLDFSLPKSFPMDGLSTTIRAANSHPLTQKKAKNLLVLGKKLPVIGLALTARQAVDRAIDGDYLGAMGEVLSGALSCGPGIGTALSIAVDLSLDRRAQKLAPPLGATGFPSENYPHTSTMNKADLSEFHQSGEAQNHRID